MSFGNWENDAFLGPGPVKKESPSKCPLYISIQVKDPVFKNFSGSAIDVIIILLVVHLLIRLLRHKHII